MSLPATVPMIAFALAASTTPGLAAQPHAGALRLAIERLGTTGRVLYVAAHPDDENTRLLAYLTGERGLDTTYVSMTRGDGGQNLIGTEQAELLGLVRTLELLEARAIDGASQLFTGAVDFGYSKGPEETLRIWGRERALGDLVRVIRTVRPDVVISRFSTKGPNHGHHTASALLAEEAFAAAADPKRFPEQKLPPWQADRLLENVSTWRLPKDADLSGYLALDVGGYSPLLGRSWGEVAAASRSMHKSQGFGAAPKRGPTLEYFEARAGTRPSKEPFEGLDLTWGRVPGTEELRALLAKALEAFDPAAPHLAIPTLVLAHRALGALPPSPLRDAKLREMEEVIVACAGLWLSATAPFAATGRGEEIALDLEALDRSPAKVRLAAVRLPGERRIAAGADLVPHEPFLRKETAKVPADAPLAIPHWLERPHGVGFFETSDPALTIAADTPAALRVAFDLEVEGLPLTVERDVLHTWTDRVRGELSRRVEVLPPVTATASRDALLVPRGAAVPLEVSLRASHGPAKGRLRLELPKGWRAEPAGADFDLAAAGDRRDVVFRISPPAAPGGAGTSRLVAEIGRRRHSWRLDAIDHPHLPMRSVLRPAEVKLVPVDLALPKRRIGHLPGPGDLVADVLRQAGFDVADLDPAAVDAAALDRFDVVLAGVRAWNANPALRHAHEALMAWVERGGLLVVQYHTSSEWEPLTAPLGPFPLEIGRGRVTDETAELVPVDPAHPILTAPNRLGPADFEGWVQERGLYFAAKWDPRYRPVFRVADPGEAPEEGSLLVARHGKGAFVYTGLSFFRQLPAGVPGALRLLANVLALSPSEVPSDGP